MTSTLRRESCEGGRHDRWEASVRLRSSDARERDAVGVVIADPDETCPGLWVDLDLDLGYCSLGDECRNPTREAHKRRVNEQPDATSHDG
jgi:hypothetical protein